MLFRRRKPVDFGERIRTALWPRRSFWRSAQYFSKRVLRLTATPHAIAAGVAAGVFASFTPFIGFHFIIAAIIAWAIAGNVVASAFGTVVGNPVTFPFIWGATLQVGRFIIHDPHVPGDEMKVGVMLRHLEFAQLWDPFLKPMTVGSIPLGIGVALIFYLLTRSAAVTFKEQRRKRLAERARRRAARQATASAPINSAAAGQ